MKITNINDKKFAIYYTLAFDKTEDWTKFIDNVKIDLLKNIKIDGFRKGKLPDHLINKHLDLTTILTASAEKASKKAQKLIETKHKNTLFEKFRVIDIKTTKLSDNDFEVIFKYQKLPNLTLKKNQDFVIDFVKFNVTEKDIQAKIAELKTNFIPWKVVDEISTIKHVLKINLQAFKNKEIVKELTMKEFNFDFQSVILGEEFNKKLLNHKAKDKLNFEVTMNKNFVLEQYRNEKINFKIEILEVKAKRDFKNDQEFLKILGIEKVKSMDELKIVVKKNLLMKKIQESHKSIIEKIWPMIIKASELDLSDDYLQTEFLRMKAYEVAKLKANQKTLDDHLKEIKKTVVEYENDVKKRTKQIIVNYLIIAKLAMKNNIDVSEQEMKQYYKFLSNREKTSIEETKKKFKEINVYNDYLSFKVEQFMIQNTLLFNKLVPNDFFEK